AAAATTTRAGKCRMSVGTALLRARRGNWKRDYGTFHTGTQGETPIKPRSWVRITAPVPDLTGLDDDECRAPIGYTVDRHARSHWSAFVTRTRGRCVRWSTCS